MTQESLHPCDVPRLLAERLGGARSVLIIACIAQDVGAVASPPPPPSPPPRAIRSLFAGSISRTLAYTSPRRRRFVWFRSANVTPSCTQIRRVSSGSNPAIVHVHKSRRHVLDCASIDTSICTCRNCRASFGPIEKQCAANLCRYACRSCDEEGVTVVVVAVKQFHCVHDHSCEGLNEDTTGHRGDGCSRSDLFTCSRSLGERVAGGARGDMRVLSITRADRADM